MITMVVIVVMAQLQLVVQPVVEIVQKVQFQIVQVTVTAVQNLGSVTVLKIVKTKHLVVT